MPVCLLLQSMLHRLLGTRPLDYGASYHDETERRATQHAAAADGSGSLRGSLRSPLASPGRSRAARWVVRGDPQGTRA